MFHLFLVFHTFFSVSIVNFEQVSISLVFSNWLFQNDHILGIILTH